MASRFSTGTACPKAAKQWHSVSSARIKPGHPAQPTKRTHEMLCFHMLGWATTDEVEAHLAKLKLADAQAAKKL